MQASYIISNSLPCGLSTEMHIFQIKPFFCPVNVPQSGKAEGNFCLISYTPHFLHAVKWGQSIIDKSWRRLMPDKFTVSASCCMEGTDFVPLKDVQHIQH